MESQRIIKAFRIHPLEIMNVRTTCHDNQFNSCSDISVEAQTSDGLTLAVYFISTGTGCSAFFPSCTHVGHLYFRCMLLCLEYTLPRCRSVNISSLAVLSLLCVIFSWQWFSLGM